MKIGRFHSGGFYLHGVTGYWVGTCSAWFNASGQLIDVEQILSPFGQSRPVKKDGPMWKQLVKLGNRYKSVPIA